MMARYTSPQQTNEIWNSESCEIFWDFGFESKLCVSLSERWWGMQQACVFLFRGCWSRPVSFAFYSCLPLDAFEAAFTTDIDVKPLGWEPQVACFTGWSVPTLKIVNNSLKYLFIWKQQTILGNFIFVYLYFYSF